MRIKRSVGAANAGAMGPERQWLRDSRPARPRLKNPRGHCRFTPPTDPDIGLILMMVEAGSPSEAAIQQLASLVEGRRLSMYGYRTCERASSLSDWTT